MTNKLVVVINSLKVPKIKKMLLNDMKFLVPNYSCLQNPWLGGYCPQIPILSVLCPQLNLLNPPSEQNSWVCHWEGVSLISWHLRFCSGQWNETLKFFCRLIQKQIGWVQLELHIIEANMMHYFSTLFWYTNSTCFGQTYCPSSGVLILYSQQ